MTFCKKFLTIDLIMEHKIKERINFLVERMSEGDNDVFDEFSEIMGKEIYHYLTRYYYETDFLKSIILDTYFTIIKKLKSKVFFIDCYQWILGVAKRKLFDKIAGDIKNKTDIIDNIDESKSSDIAYLIESLNASDQQLLYLKYNRGQTPKEIAKILHKPKFKVEKRMNEVIAFIEKEFYKDKPKEDIAG